VLASRKLLPVPAAGWLVAGRGRGVLGAAVTWMQGTRHLPRQKPAPPKKFSVGQFFIYIFGVIFLNLVTVHIYLYE